MLPVIGRGMKMYPRPLPSPALSVTVELERDRQMNADEFGHLFIECVEETLTDLLGWKVREGLLDYLARQAHLARADLLEHPSELSTLLEKSLGRGAIEIERCIMRRLHAVLESECKENSDFNFANQVEEARARWKTTCSTLTLS